MDKVSFVVVGEHTLGLINPMLPDTVQVLHSSVLRGSPWGSYSPSEIPVPMDLAKMRPATRADFDDYRISTEGYSTNPRYDFPAA